MQAPLFPILNIQHHSATLSNMVEMDERGKQPNLTTAHPSDMSTDRQAQGWSDEPSRRNSVRQVLGRTSIEARRRSPMTSLEYKRSTSGLGFYSSDISSTSTTVGYDDPVAQSLPQHSSSREGHHNLIPLPSLGTNLVADILYDGLDTSQISTNTFGPSDSLASSGSRLSLDSTNSVLDALTLPRRSMGIRPAALVYSQRSRLPSMLEEPSTPARRREVQSRFSTSPGPCRRSSGRAVVRRTPEVFHGKPSADLRRARARAGTTVHNDAIHATEPSMGKRPSFASLKKIIGRSPGAHIQSSKTSKPALPPFPFDTSNSLGEITENDSFGFTTHRARSKGSCEPSIPITIEVAPFEFSDTVPRQGGGVSSIPFTRWGANDLDSSSIYGGDRKAGANLQSSVSKAPETVLDVPHTADTTAEHRSTILVRGSWIEIGKGANEISSAKNGGVKGWWSRLRKSGGQDSRACETGAPPQRPLDDARSSKRRLPSIGPTQSLFRSTRSVGLGQLYSEKQVADIESQSKERPSTFQRAFTKSFSTMQGSRVACMRPTKVRPPIPFSAEVVKKTSPGLSDPNQPKAECEATVNPTRMNMPATSGLRPLRLAVSQTRGDGIHDPAMSVTKERAIPATTSSPLSPPIPKRNRSLPLPYLHEAKNKTAASPLTVTLTTCTQDEPTQRTIGSSILFLDDELNDTSQSLAKKANIIPSPSTKICSSNMLTPAGNSSVSTMEATDILFSLIRHFKNEGSPSTFASNNTARAEANSTLSPNARRKACTVAKAKRNTCTTMETILTYQSSTDSLSSHSATRTLASDAEGDERQSARREGDESLLEDLIEGVVNDVPPSAAPSRRTRTRTHSSSSRICASPVVSTIRSSSHPSSLDSAYSGFCWPPSGHPAFAARLATTPQRGKTTHGQIRMLGAGVVARELSESFEPFESPCPESRSQGRMRSISALSCPRPKARPSSELDLTRLTPSTSCQMMDITVSQTFVPDVTNAMLAIGRKADSKYSAAPRRQKAVDLTPSTPTAFSYSPQSCSKKRRSKSFSVRQTPPVIRVERPQSDSTLSQHGDMLNDEDAIIHRASIARKSTASVLDFSLIAARTSLYAGPSRSRNSSLFSSDGKQRLQKAPGSGGNPLPWSSLSNTAALSPQSASLSPASSSHRHWSDISASFAWSEGSKRLSFGTTCTVPSPGWERSRSGEEAKQIFDEKQARGPSEHIKWTQSALSELRDSLQKYPDSPYSRSIMEGMSCYQRAKS